MSSPAMKFNDDHLDREKQMENYAIYSRTEILYLMRAIQQRRLLVNLDLPNSRQIVVTSIIAVNERTHALILDVARGDALNQELLSGKGAEFITQLEGVSISFQTGTVTLCTHEKLPALRIALPKRVIRLQRREHFRVHVPMSHAVKCIVPAAASDGHEPIHANIVDIGGGGVAISDSSGRLGTETGRIFPDCRLLLPDMDVIVTPMEIRNSAQIRLANGAFQTRLGCKFINLPKDMATTLQRFIMSLELERRNSL